jgi:hypothetical protein
MKGKRGEDPTPGRGGADASGQDVGSRSRTEPGDALVLGARGGDGVDDCARAGVEALSAPRN